MAVRPRRPSRPHPRAGRTPSAADRGDHRLDDRAVFPAVVYVLTSGCAWRHLPPSFRGSDPTAHRFTIWLRQECSTNCT
ncbi:transposase [Rhodococcus opacus]|uniref:transposase n=1 Tax=Rhodococcus opacus TaxID=37919 RepID=UPI00374EB0B4